MTAGSCILESKRVQAPYGAQVLSVMCWRTDRWVPPTERAGSEGVIYAACGSAAADRRLYTHRREAAIPQPSATKWLSNLRTLRPMGPVNLKNLSPHNPSIQPAPSGAPPFLFCGASRHHNPRPKGPSPLSTQPAAAGGHNLQPRRGWPPSPLNPLNPLNPVNPACGFAAGL